MLQALPDEFRGIAALLEEHLPRLLGPDLVGLYVYGSALDPSFVPGRSDLDCLVVTETALDRPRFEVLSAWLDQTAGREPSLSRVQMSFLVRDHVLNDDPDACLYQFGILSRSGSDGNPIVWLDFFARGMVLHGTSAAAAVAQSRSTAPKPGTSMRRSPVFHLRAPPTTGAQGSFPTTRCRTRRRCMHFWCISGTG